MPLLNRAFYQKPTLKVARNILGCFLVRKMGNKIIKGMITETEAYIGEDDLACHASKGRTPRTEIMYGEAGRAYVYMIYGMYHCLNIVTEKKDFPAAVLIRALTNICESKTNSREWIPVKNVPDLNGPGKLCKFLKIDRKLNGWGIAREQKLWIEKPPRKQKLKIRKAERIRIGYARHCQHYLWRFCTSTNGRKQGIIKH